MNIVEEIKNDLSGAMLLNDWLGDGGVPAHEMVADFRAKRCVSGNDGKPCPNNTAPNWWNWIANLKDKIAMVIRGQLELKHNLGLKTAHDESLFMCKQCGCCLKLKVWTPRDHLRKHTTKEVLDKTPDYCWLRKECS